MEKSIRIIPGSNADNQRFTSFRRWVSRSLAIGAFGLAGLGAMAQMPSGTYTVDPNNQPSSTNFTTIQGFFTALSNNGNAIAAGGARLEIYPGTYTEQITIPAIQGLGPVQGGADRLVITSHSSGQAKVQYSAAGSFSNHNGAVFFLNEADYITFDNLEIENTNNNSWSYTWCIQGYKGANNIQVMNCTLKGATYSGSGSRTYSYGVGTTDYYYASGGSTNGQDWEVTGNDIESYYGAYFYGYTSSSYRRGFTLNDNTFDCSYPAYFLYVYDVEVNDNVFAGSNSYMYYGMYFRYVNNITALRNDISGHTSYPVYAYYINSRGTGQSGQSVIANNSIHTPNPNVTWSYACYLGYFTKTDFVYNSFYTPGGQNYYGMYLYYDLTDSRIMNNVFRSEAGTIQWFYRYNWNNNYNDGLGIDYNTYYSEAVDNGNVTPVYYWRGSTTYQDNTLSDHISNTSQNSNSQNADPSFISTTDLHVNGVGLYQKGVSVSSVTVDVDGTTRPATPSPGIHEYTPKDYDAGVVRFDDPVSQCADTNDIIVTVRNFAKLPLDSFRIHYNYTGNGGASGSGSMPVVASVALQPGDDTTLTLGDVFMTSGAPGYTFTAYTSHPNGQTDEQMENDTNVFHTQTAMIDTFTIGSTVGKDFATFTDAANALVGFGICGPVVFYVEQGKYNEQILLSDLQGTSDVNTVLFQADPSNTGLVEVEFTTGSSSGDAAVVKLNNTSYVTFDGVHVENLSTAYYAHAIQMLGTCTDNAFINGSLTVPTGTNYYSRPIQMQTGKDLHNITFDNNELYGGYMGFYIYGDWNDGPEGLKFTNNMVTDAYYYGGYIYYQDEFEFSGNEIHMSSYSNTQAYAYSYAAYLYNYNANTAIVNNNYMRSNGYGTYLYVAGSKNIGEVEVINNIFHTGDTTNSTSNYGYYGLRYTGGFGLIAHNTIIREKNFSSNGYTAYMGGGLNAFYNNLVMTIGSGQNIYVPGTFIISESDNNAYVLIETSNGKPSNGTDYMQNIGLDDNSFDLTTPVYDKLDSLHTCSDSLPGMGVYLEDVPFDYNGIARNTSAPTIGHEEYSSPDAFTLGDDFDKCADDTVYIGQEVFGATYLWSPGGETTGIIMVTEPGTYTVDMVGGCGDADATVTISAGEPIAAFSEGVPSWLTVEFTNTSTKSDTWMWDFDDGTTSTDENPTHLFPGTGTYNVCLTATGECGDDTECRQIAVSDYVGIKESDLSNAVSIVPNPASDVLFVNVDNVEGDVLNIELSNIAGQVVVTRQLNEFNGTAKEQIDVNELTEGVYFVKVYTNEASTTQRVVVQ